MGMAGIQGNIQDFSVCVARIPARNQAAFSRSGNTSAPAFNLSK